MIAIPDKFKRKKFHSLCIAAPSSGSGKTTLTLGILRLLSRKGWKVQPFKCGPDYIDTEYHKLACGTESINLDAWMMGKDGVRYSYFNAVSKSDFAVIEGVMGLFDGAFPDKTDGSTAQISGLISSPIVLVADFRSMARSAAAIVKGFSCFDKNVRIRGVIANNVSSDTHAEIISRALDSEGLPPLIGALPKNSGIRLPERHLGLFPAVETMPDDKWFDGLADFVESHVDLEKLLKISESSKMKVKSGANRSRKEKIPLAVAYDKAFHFYYKDNLDLLEKSGFELLFFSPLTDSVIPEKAEALYIGGGFPEVFAGELAKNKSMKESVRNFFELSKTIYAECGGLMYLCEKITGTDNREYEMCGIIPAASSMDKKLSLGYTESETLSDSFFGPAGTVFRGHEFHWSSLSNRRIPESFCEIRKPGRAGKTSLRGFKIKNLVATYIHAHFLSNSDMVNSWVDFVRENRRTNG